VDAEQVTRRARRVERSRQELEAAGASQSEVAAALEQAERDDRAWSAGAQGERTVAQTLEILSRYGWLTLHDVPWPDRPEASIDHIAIGPGGVAVIDAKNWTGDVAMRDGVLWKDGYRRERELESVASATDAVTALLTRAHRSAAFGLICLVSQDQAVAPACPGVRVVGRAQLALFLTGLPPRLTPYDVADLGRHLTRELVGPGSPPQTTTALANAVPEPRRPA